MLLRTEKHGRQPQSPSPLPRPPQDVLHRHALYLIVRMVCYDDGLGAGKSLLALKTTDASSEEYSLWVYQCSSLVRFPVTWSVIRPTQGQNQSLFSLARAEGMLFTLCLKPGKYNE